MRVVSGFEFEGDVRTIWLKLVRGIVSLRCDYQAEYTKYSSRGNAVFCRPSVNTGFRTRKPLCCRGQE